MTIEASQFINTLNTSFPRSTDLLKEGDDHIRLIKANLKNTFPNIITSVSMSSDTLNYLNSHIQATASGVKLNGSLTSGTNAGIDFSSSIVHVGNSDDINTLNENTAINWHTLKIIYQSTFPVNSVISCAVNPGGLPIWKGTQWVEFAQGRLLAGSGSNSVRNYSPYNNYGSGSISLNERNIPAHNHGVTASGRTTTNGNHQHDYYYPSYDDSGDDNSDGAANNVIDNTGKTSWSGDHFHDVTVNGSTDWKYGNGSGVDAINIEPLCVAVPFWQRIK
ncbi:TPA: hypothetical protein RFV54_001060 [Klebsiella aerogenes]|nr:hypothetical protein [Klebsiella aerogenes]